MSHVLKPALLAAAACAVLASPAALAAKPQLPQINLDDPQGVMQANRKIQCSTQDNLPITYWWHGDMFSRVQGERDRLLFKVQGMNIRQCATVTDPEKGTGYKMVSREILLYLDPQTGQVARSWKNPWTGEDVKVLHVANDPVNFTAWPVGRDGKPAKWTGTIHGNRWWNTNTFPLFYQNPLGGDYQKYVGGFYHATEMFNFLGDVDSLRDPRRHTADVQVGWVRVSSWLPWMEMSGRGGEVYFHTAGVKLASFDDLPAVMKDEIAANYPEYVAPPPTDDARPNETSWTYFKKKVQPQAGGGGH
jgi:hypothetical protein